VVQGTVAEDDEVEEPKVSGCGEQDLGRIGDRQPLQPAMRDLAGVSADLQPLAPWSPDGIRQRHEYGQVVGQQRQPPAAKSCGSEMRERRSGWEEQGPGAEFVDVSDAACQGRIDRAHPLPVSIKRGR